MIVDCLAYFITLNNFQSYGGGQFLLVDEKIQYIWEEANDLLQSKLTVFHKLRSVRAELNFDAN
jgi:hypothetical protein